MPPKMDSRYEIVRGFGDDVFAELWDKTMAPAGLAFLLRRCPEGHITLAGFDVDVPVEVFQQFFSEVLSYIVEDQQSLLGTCVAKSPNEGG